MALYKDESPPERRLCYLVPCNESDPYQQWKGESLEGDSVSSTMIENLGSNECLTSMEADPVATSDCQGTLTLTVTVTVTLPIMFISTSDCQNESSPTLNR